MSQVTASAPQIISLAMCSAMATPPPARIVTWSRTPSHQMQMDLFQAVFDEERVRPCSHPDFIGREDG